MKLQYKILWFEDNSSWFDTVKAFINEFLDENGFELVEDHYKGSVESIIEIVSQKHYDLILMDFNLEGTKGDEIIEIIRSHDFYTELLFYSQDGAKSLRNIIHEKGVDGVYCSGREIFDFETKVIGIIRNTIRRIQDVNNMRGLVIAETIDLEIRIENILKNYFKITNENRSCKVTSQLEKIFSNKTQQLNRQLEIVSALNSKTIEELIDEDILTTANVYNALQSLLKAEIKEINNLLADPKLDYLENLFWENQKKELCILKDELKLFDEEIIKTRNTLAHVKELVDEEGLSYLESLHKSDGTKIVFDNNKYIKIRKDIRKHSSVLSNIELLISPSNQHSKEAAPSQ